MIRHFVDYIRLPERRSTGLIFFALSLSIGAWVTRLPEIKSELVLSNAQLGLALLCIPFGSAVLLPFYGTIIRRLGEKKATLLGVFSFLLAILLPMLMTDLYSFMGALFLVGLAIGVTDVSMNAIAAEIEKQYNCQIMSASHGFFSLGGMVGAATSGFFISLGLSPLEHLLFWSVLLLVLILPSGRFLINAKERSAPGKSFQLPPKAMLVLALISFCIMMCEGGITDWGTIYIREDLLASAEIAGLGFAGFSALMALGRFAGDGLINRFGTKRLLLYGLLLAVLGLGISVLGSINAAIIGFSLAGIGYATVFPILFGSAARVEGVASEVGIASVASSGYIGILVGPAVIGFIAEQTSLAGGFIFLLALTLIGWFLSFKVR